MGCGCGGSSKLPEIRDTGRKWAPSTGVQKFTNVSDQVLTSRNPRFELPPGQSIDLDVTTVHHTVRAWMRSGALVVERQEIKVADVKPPAKKAAKPRATKPRAAAT